ncbi:hypothetical protein BBBOND_0110840 [Babesia bigemina]|uniref:Uncharacterized protein n=1 Tax=Babesia bigemina TaxID=5866 RepID=A0A061D410_BABBI|nr:hypothetical protein BBBOND_0110840 [Babesia bigemina]CDR94787.1 hypothetical protein BBBOND_0110840 [Babesia bigemina]|eukprot:XP_012766973.1 hypothetical protein BBBOND_0110840 [Babesia bigemina]
MYVIGSCCVAAAVIVSSTQLSAVYARTSDVGGSLPVVTEGLIGCADGSEGVRCSPESSEQPGSLEDRGITDAPVTFRQADLPMLSSLIGRCTACTRYTRTAAYGGQAIALNAIFTALALLAQRLQELLDIDTGALLLGRLTGLLTVTIGGYAAYKLSEQLLELTLAALSSGSASRTCKEILAHLRRRASRSITAPLGAIAAVGHAAQTCTVVRSAAKGLAPRLTPLAAAMRDVSGVRYARAAVPSWLSYSDTSVKEAAVIAAYCISTFLLLGGSLHSFTPSNVTHPGAFAVPSTSLSAEGYTYANRRQKRVIQQLGRTYGCHSCGRSSASGQYIADHQPPSGVIKRRLRRPVVKLLVDHHIVPLSLVRPRQYFYPQCPACSAEQSNAVRTNRKKVVTHYGVFRPYYLCASGYLAAARHALALPVPAPAESFGQA